MHNSFRVTYGSVLFCVCCIAHSSKILKTHHISYEFYRNFAYTELAKDCEHHFADLEICKRQPCFTHSKHSFNMLIKEGQIIPFRARFNAWEPIQISKKKTEKQWPKVARPVYFSFCSELRQLNQIQCYCTVDHCNVGCLLCQDQHSFFLNQDFAFATTTTTEKQTHRLTHCMESKHLGP